MDAAVSAVAKSLISAGLLGRLPGIRLPDREAVEDGSPGLKAWAIDL
jgi:hypothetical protein